MTPRVHPGPSVASGSSGNEIDAEDIARSPGEQTSEVERSKPALATPRQVQVECVAPYKEAAWMPIGREEEGVAAASVQYSQGLRPPGHLTSFIRLAGHVSKGITYTQDNSMVFVVMAGKVTVMLNTQQFVAARGDTFYIPPYNTYNILNMGREEAELFNFQYRSFKTMKKEEK